MRRLPLVAVALAWAVAAVAQSTPAVSARMPRDVIEQQPPAAGEPSPLTRAETRTRVVREVAKAEHVDASRVRVIDEADRVWPDADLGCPARKGLREPAPVEGYAFDVEVDGRRFTYHTDRHGKLKRCPPAKPRSPHR